MAERAYGGVPAEQRHARRRDALIEAAMDGLHADGLAGTGVRSVCARARLTPRYFYECFPDLEALLITAVDTVMAEVAACSVAAMRTAPSGDVGAQVRAALDAGYGVVAVDPRKGDVLLAAAAGSAALRERRHRAVADYADLVLESLPLLRGLGLAERRRARTVSLFLVAGSFDVIEAVLAGRLRLSRTRLVNELTTMWLGALTAALPAAAAPGRG